MKYERIDPDMKNPGVGEQSGNQLFVCPYACLGLPTVWPALAFHWTTGCRQSAFLILSYPHKPEQVMRMYYKF